MRDFAAEEGRRKQERASEKMDAIVHRRLLQKWHQRTVKTREYRRTFAAFNRNKAFRLKVKIWRALRWRRDVCFDLSKGLGNLESMMRVKILANGIKSIAAYSRSKKMVVARDTKRTLQDLHSILLALHEKRAKKAIERWKNWNRVRRIQLSHGRSIVAKVSNADLRTAFIRWADCFYKEKFA